MTKIVKFTKKINYLFGKAILFYFVAVVSLFLMQYGYYAFLPLDNWFKYYSISPTKDTYAIGEEIYFRTDNDVFRDVRFTWLDILRCEQNGETAYFSSYISSANAEPRPRNTSGRLWRYGASTPMFSTTCYLDSTQAVTFPYGIIRYTKMNSNTFTIE